MPGIPPPPGTQCRCCGVAILSGTEMHYKLGLCVACTACNRKHGDALEAHARALVADGRMTPWHCVALLTLDNAQLWGSLDIRIADNGLADLIVRESPRPWQVVFARCAATNRIPTQDEVMAACLAPHVPGPDTIERRQAIADEITTALCWIDGNVSSVDVDFEKDTLDLGHLIIRVNLKTAVPGAILRDVSKIEQVDIPPDIMARPRGLA